MNKDGRLCLCCNEFRAYLICGTCGEETKEREGVYFSDKDAAYFEAVDEEHERRVDWRRREWRERRERLDRDIQASAIDYKMEERRVCEDDLIKRWGRVLTFQEERKRIKIEADFNSRKGHDLSDYKSEKEWSPHRSLPIWDTLTTFAWSHSWRFRCSWRSGTWTQKNGPELPGPFGWFRFALSKPSSRTDRSGSSRLSCRAPETALQLPAPLAA